MNWAAIDWGRFVEALIVLGTGLGLYLQQRAAAMKVNKKLDHNTARTEDAAQSAAAAVAAATAVERAQVDEWDVYRARRVLAALETLPECAPCHSEILKIEDRRRVWAKQPPPTSPTESP